MLKLETKGLDSNCGHHRGALANLEKQDSLKLEIYTKLGKGDNGSGSYTWTLRIGFEKWAWPKFTEH
jgi:hypothetical protein